MKLWCEASFEPVRLSLVSRLLVSNLLLQKALPQPRINDLAADCGWRWSRAGATPGNFPSAPAFLSFSSSCLRSQMLSKFLCRAQCRALCSQLQMLSKFLCKLPRRSEVTRALQWKWASPAETGLLHTRAYNSSAASYRRGGGLHERSRQLHR